MPYLLPVEITAFSLLTLRGLTIRNSRLGFFVVQQIAFGNLCFLSRLLVKIVISCNRVAKSNLFLDVIGWIRNDAHVKQYTE